MLRFPAKNSYFVIIIKAVTLSIIIVSYNVKYFLEQCLCSVKKAIDKIDAEVIVIDNDSADGSMDYLKLKFPWVKFIVNKKNEGFSKANNLALLLSKSKYILFLNPDTIVPENSFEDCISFMETHPEAGAMAVKMIDGHGRYLKESKRCFPSPWVAFCKLLGLTALFPHSKLFAGYYLGHLSEKENQIIDAISGAFMFARKDALDKTGGFDERFFMYGEDIDLSYRIQQSGYVNYYLSETIIIHFKGESTRKNFRYVKMFYKAMSLFVHKHFDKKKSFVFIILIDVAIAVLGLFSAVKNLFRTQRFKKNNLPRKIFLYGDIESKEKLTILLPAGKIFLCEKESGAEEIILCEGKAFSFKKIIDYVQRINKKCNYNFHAAGSNSVIGINPKKIIALNS